MLRKLSIDRLWGKIRDFFEMPSFDITPEKEEEIIEELAQKIVKQKIEIPALMLLEGFKPVFPVLSQTYLLQMAPLLDLLGIKTEELVVFLSKGENVRRLQKRIEELKDKKKIDGKHTRAHKRKI